VIRLLPAYDETFVLTLSSDEVMRRIHDVTSMTVETDRPIFFNGWVKGERFKIALRHKRPSSYNPLISGRAEGTSQGTILFMRYQLMPNLKLMLMFWLMLIALGSLIISFQYKNILYLLGGVGVNALLYWIVRSNFQLQRQEARRALLRVLS
jgi:hypothetical protein